PPKLISQEVDQGLRTEIDLPQTGGAVDPVRPGTHDQLLTPPGPLRRRMADHSHEVEGGAHLLVVVPAGDVKHRQVQFAKTVLIADRLPPIVQVRMTDLLPPMG